MGKLLSVLLFMLFIPLSYSASCRDVKTCIPEKAFKYRDLIYSEIETYFPEIPIYAYVPSLIEYESCISLTHRRCWEPTSRLKTKREEGAGLSMVTRAYNSDGSIRFDTLTDLRRKYIEELKEASWDTIYQRPDIQIRILVLLSRDNYKALYSVTDPMERLYMADSAYNGGLSGVFKDRRACSLAPNCDPQKWFNNVEKYCTKSKKILYGNRNACDINRHHVKDVLKTRLPKYETNYFNEFYLKLKKESFASRVD